MALPQFLGPSQQLVPLRAGDVLGGGGPVSNKLNFTVEPQKQTQWCWAAVASSISKYYDVRSHWTQCEVANSLKNTTVCCGSQGSSATCNVASALDEALVVTSNYVSMQREYKKDAWPTSPFDSIMEEINKGRIIATRVGWSGGGGHFQTIYGWLITESGEKYISISDPIYRSVEILFEEFAQNYQSGGWWNISYFTAPNSPVVAGADPGLNDLMLSMVSDVAVDSNVQDIDLIGN